MEFDKIVLTFSERSVLKKSRYCEVDVSSCGRLLRHGLVYEGMVSSGGGLPIGTGKCRITPLGVDYLLYRKDLASHRFVIPIIVSVITNLVIFVIKSAWPLLLELIQHI